MDEMPADMNWSNSTSLGALNAIQAPDPAAAAAHQKAWEAQERQRHGMQIRSAALEAALRLPPENVEALLEWAKKIEGYLAGATS